MVAIMRDIHVSQGTRLDHGCRQGLARDRVGPGLGDFDFFPINLHLDLFDRWRGLSINCDCDGHQPATSSAGDGVVIRIKALAFRCCSPAAPFATNSSLNLPTKLCTGHEQASPKAQIVRPPGMLSAILTR